jgi:peptidoglycan/xylan/chitin deacetylase (PgdA/CDA1 family)
MRVGLPILAYHSIDTSGSVISTDPAWFVETMTALHRAGFRTVNLADWVSSGCPALERQFAITFDDGYASTLPALNVLESFQFHATVFLISGRVGGDNEWSGQPRGIPRLRLLSWQDVTDLARRGFALGAHSRSHGRLDDCNDAELDAELAGSQSVIEWETGRPCRLFAYPYGRASTRVQIQAARYFDAAFRMTPGGRWSAHSHHAIPRIDAFDLRTSSRITSLIGGSLPKKLWMRWWVRSLRDSWLGHAHPGAPNP